MRILHISDLHYRPETDDDRTPIIEAAVMDLNEYAARRAFDAVIFTGDLVYSGSSVEAFQSGLTTCIDPLLGAVGLDRPQLCVVPGNHDIDPAAIVMQVETTLPAELDSIQKVNHFVDDPAALPLRTSRLANYHAFIADTWPDAAGRPDQLGRCQSIDTPSGSLAIAIANTAWRATGRPNDVDRHNLHVSERQLQQLASDLENSDLRIFASHHPPEWLADFDRHRLERDLANRYHAALFGHTHHPHPLASIDEHGFLFSNTTGALFQGADRRTCYTILDFDQETNEVTCHYRSYSVALGVFVPDTDLAASGGKSFPFALQPESSLRGVATPPVAPVPADPRIALRQQLSDSLVLVQTPHAPHIDGLDLLIEPAAYLVREQRQSLFADDGTPVPRVPLADWVVDTRPVFLFGPRETGKTCALNWMLRECMKETQRHAIFIDLASVPPSSGAIRRALRNRLLSAGIRTRDDLADAPAMAIAFDNLNPANSRLIRHVFDLVSFLPPTPVFFGVLDEGVTPPPDKWWPEADEVRTAFLGFYGARDVRSLVQALYPDLEPEQHQSILHSALELMLNQGLSRAPWTVVMVLLVFQYEPAFQNTDVTVLVDRYLDLVLGKWSTDDPLATNFDHANRKHFLCQLAVYLDSRKRKTAPETELVDFAGQYIERFGAPITANSLVSDLLDRRILGGNSSEIGFALGEVEQFLLATAAEAGEIDPGSFLTDEERYFDAIVHFAGLGRKPRMFIDHLAGEVIELLDGLAVPDSILFTSVDKGAWGDMPGLDETHRRLQKLGERLGAAQSEEGQDKYADYLLESREQYSADDDVGPEGEGEGDGDGVGDETSVDDARRGVVHLLQVVTLLSLCLQRSDHVGDQSYRVQVIELAIRGWAGVFVAACAIDSQISDEDRERRIRELKDAGLDAKRIEALIQFGGFLDTVGLIEGLLATPRLRPTLGRLFHESAIPEEDMIGRVLLWALLFAELADGWKELLADLLDRFGRRPHLVRILQMILGSRYYDRTVESAAISAIEGSLADLMVSHITGTQARVGRAESVRQLQEFRRRSISIQRAELDIGSAPEP